MKLVVYGFSGSCEELQRLLKGGIHVESIKANNKGFTIDFSEKEKPAGRPPKFSEEDFQKMYKAHMAGKSYSEIGKQFKCSRTYACRVVKEICSKKNLQNDNDIF